MDIKKKLLKRVITEEVFLVPVGQDIYETNGLFALTEVGEFIWDRLPQAQVPEDILKAILEEYDVEETVARRDLEAFLEKLRTMKIID